MLKCKRVSEKPKTGLMGLLKESAANTRAFSPGTENALKGVASVMTVDLFAGRGTKIKNATTETLMAVVKEVTKKGNELTHTELDVLLRVAVDSKTEKQTLTLIQNTREPEEYKNKNLVVTRVQPEDVVPVLKLLKFLDNKSQASVIVKKVIPEDVKGVLPFLRQFVDKSIRLALINKCPEKDLAALFESFKDIPITKDEVDFLRRSELRPHVALLIFNAIDQKNYSPELIHWAINHTSGEEVYAIYKKTHNYLHNILDISDDAAEHEKVYHLYKLMFYHISPNYKALTSYLQSSTPTPADLISLKNLFDLFEDGSMYIFKSIDSKSNAKDIYNKFLQLSYDICTLAGVGELFVKTMIGDKDLVEGEDDATSRLYKLTTSIKTPTNIVKTSAANLIESYRKLFEQVLTRHTRDKSPEIFELSSVLNKVLRFF